MAERPIRFFVILAAEAMTTLREAAKHDRRTPQDEAAVLLEGLLAAMQLRNELRAEDREIDAAEAAEEADPILAFAREVQGRER